MNRRTKCAKYNENEGWLELTCFNDFMMRDDLVQVIWSVLLNKWKVNLIWDFLNKNEGDAIFELTLLPWSISILSFT